MATSVVLVYSGGLDSTVLLYHLRAMGKSLCCLSFDYGQRHHREIESAQVICESLSVEHTVVDISPLKKLFGKSALTNTAVPIPHGHYADASMKSTIVPNRNMIMISAAIACALSRGASSVAYGAHSGDHAIYPDCRPEFAEALSRAAQLCDWQPVSVEFPWITMTKAAIVQRGLELKVPFEMTWSCYEGGAVHCGRCGTCTERKEAFQTAGLTDPTCYA